jgi:tRNA pseudouridine13 synthase
VRIKTIPEDFRVEEQIDLPREPNGPYTLYRVEKRELTTAQVEAALSSALSRQRGDVHFPGIKDKRAVAVQYVAIKGRGPREVRRKRFSAERVGRVARQFQPSDLLGNSFTVVLRDLDEDRAAKLGAALERLATGGIPNYFDQQRFGSQLKSGGLPGKRVFQRDSEGMLRAHLAEPMVGDPARVQRLKEVAAEHWGDWNTVFEAAPKPSNFRSVLTYLRDHPTGYRRALDLVTPRVLGLYIMAYQSLLWNRIAAGYMVEQAGAPSGTVDIAGEPFPLFDDIAAYVPADMRVQLPYHGARYGPDMAPVVAAVLEQEGLELNDLKPRILSRVYLPRAKRPLLGFPRDVSASPVAPDDRFEGRYRVTLSFTLPPGSYATLALKAL